MLANSKLTKDDKCSRCGAFGLVRYVKTDKYLDFCDQHAQFFHKGLTDQGWKISEDIRDKKQTKRRKGDDGRGRVIAGL